MDPNQMRPITNYFAPQPQQQQPHQQQQQQQRSQQPLQPQTTLPHATSSIYSNNHLHAIQSLPLSSTTSAAHLTQAEVDSIVNTTAAYSTNAGGPSGTSPTPAQVAGVKRSSGGHAVLSDAARKAILDGASEGSNKKAKTSNDSSTTKVADIFTKASQPAATKFNKPRASSVEDLRLGLATQPKLLETLKLEFDTLGEDWLLALQDEFTKSYFQQLKDFLIKEQTSKTIFPPPADIYSWSRFTPLKDVRVVIVGQDPYHDDLQAHGLAFSVRKGIRIPPSLRNIYKQMADDIPGFKIPLHGDLTPWAKHGVLLLNTSLTVRAHEAASHNGRGWETFTAAILKVIIDRMAASGSADHVPGAKGVVFLVWGAHAQKMCQGVDKTKHLVLKSAHPSPLSANRGFFGNGHFKKANEWLVERYGPEGGIDWVALSEEQRNM